MVPIPHLRRTMKFALSENMKLLALDYEPLLNSYFKGRIVRKMLFWILNIIDLQKVWLKIYMNHFYLVTKSTSILKNFFIEKVWATNSNHWKFNFFPIISKQIRDCCWGGFTQIFQNSLSRPIATYQYQRGKW